MHNVYDALFYKWPICILAFFPLSTTNSNLGLNMAIFKSIMQLQLPSTIRKKILCFLPFKTFCVFIYQCEDRYLIPNNIFQYQRKIVILLDNIFFVCVTLNSMCVLNTIFLTLITNTFTHKRMEKKRKCKQQLTLAILIRNKANRKYNQTQNRKLSQSHNVSRNPSRRFVGLLRMCRRQSLIDCPHLQNLGS